MSKLWVCIALFFLASCARPYYIDIANYSGSDISAVRGDGYVVVTIKDGAVGRVPYMPASRCLLIRSEGGLKEYELTAPGVNYFKDGGVLSAIYSSGFELALFSQHALSEGEIVLKETNCLKNLPGMN